MSPLDPQDKALPVSKVLFLLIQDKPRAHITLIVAILSRDLIFGPEQTRQRRACRHTDSFHIDYRHHNPALDGPLGWKDVISDMPVLLKASAEFRDHRAVEVR
jgi:hypothetical protein